MHSTLSTRESLKQPSENIMLIQADYILIFKLGMVVLIVEPYNM